ncbi:helix-turn-helix domain-containing protein [Oscillibacter ruminantium]
MKPEVLTVQETAQLLKTTRQQIRKMILIGELPAAKVGREWRIQVKSLVEFLDEQI